MNFLTQRGMKALVVRKPLEMSVETVSIPAIKEDEVLVQVKSVGICGSDVEIKNGTYPDFIRYPIIPGHETAGVVVEVGKSVAEIEVGDAVAIEPHAGCGQCKNCKIGYYSYCLNYGKPMHRALGFTVDGGFAEYVAAPARNLHKLPQGISFEEGSMIVSSGTAMFGVLEIGLMPGENVVIIGPGPIGLTSLIIARAMGAGMITVTGTRWDRLNLAKELGANVLVNIREEDPVKKVMEMTDEIGADLVINTAPTPESVNQGLDMLRRGGRLLMLGLTWEPTSVVLGKLASRGITVKGTRGEAQNALSYLIRMARASNMNFKKLITHTFKLDEAVRAFEVAEKRIGDPLKVVVKP